MNHLTILVYPLCLHYSYQEFKMTYCFFANSLWLYCIYIKWSTIFFFLYNKNERFSRIHSQFRNCFCDNDFLRRESIIFERIQYNLTFSLENLRFSSRLSYISCALFHVFCSLEKYLWIHYFLRELTIFATVFGNSP